MIIKLPLTNKSLRIETLKGVTLITLKTEGLKQGESLALIKNTKESE